MLPRSVSNRLSKNVTTSRRQTEARGEVQDSRCRRGSVDNLLRRVRSTTRLRNITYDLDDNETVTACALLTRDPLTSEIHRAFPCTLYLRTNVYHEVVRRALRVRRRAAFFRDRSLADAFPRTSRFATRGDPSWDGEGTRCQSRESRSTPHSRVAAGSETSLARGLWSIHGHSGNFDWEQYRDGALARDFRSHLQMAEFRSTMKY